MGLGLGECTQSIDDRSSSSRSGRGQTCTCCVLLLLLLGLGGRRRLRPVPSRPWLELARTVLKLDAIGQGEAAEQGEVQSYIARNMSHF